MQMLLQQSMCFLPKMAEKLTPFWLQLCSLWTGKRVLEKGTAISGHVEEVFLILFSMPFRCL